MAIKPILFNTEMVRAILEGRKSCTRRVVKNMSDTGLEPDDYIFEDVEDATHKKFIESSYKPPYQPGDIIYIRETWFRDSNRYMYRANYSDNEKFYRNGEEIKIKWHQSIHMPKEAARIWLKVTDVRVERLQNMDWRDALDEGVNTQLSRDKKTGEYIFDENPIDDFIDLWNSTIKKSDLDRYGWNANPWVWVIEFERCEKPENL